MAEEIVKFNIQYEVSGIDGSVRNTQRLLYAMNAVRLSVRDIQDVMAGPTLQNVMWTAIQLTRVWTTLYRLVSATNREQKLGLAMGAGRAVSGGAGAAFGQTTLAFGAGGQLGAAAQGTLWGTITAFAMANPIVVGAAAAALVVGGAVAWDVHQKNVHNEWLQRQREIAKSQGIEY